MRTICVRPRTAAVDRAFDDLIEREGSCWVGPPAEMLVNPRVAFPTSEKYADVSVASDRACAVSKGGRLQCCGRKQGAVPDGRFLSVRLSEEFSCALDGRGHVSCWGASGPEPAKSPPGVFKQLSVSLSDACGLTAEGTVACSPPRAAPPPGSLLAFAIGEQGGVGLRADHSLQVWSGTKATSVAGYFVAVAAEPTRYCGLTQQGGLVCRTDQLEPVTSVPAIVSQASLSPGMTCGITGKPGGPPGPVQCWRVPDLHLFAVPQGAFAKISVSRSSQAACGIRADGSIECWGEFYPALALGHPAL